MCGIAGALLTKDEPGIHGMTRAVVRMCDRMHARGPDAEGYWSDSNVPMILGHRRLSILDLNPRANQPMVSDGSRYVIVSNGEIYNFRELRRELEQDGVVFRTESDTEVLVQLESTE